MTLVGPATAFLRNGYLSSQHNQWWTRERSVAIVALWDQNRRRKWQPTPVFFPRESRGQSGLVGYCPQGHTESDTTEATQHACRHWRRKWQPTPVFLPGDSQGQRILVGCHLRSHTELDTTEVTQQQKQHTFLCCANAFKFTQVPLVYFCFYFHQSRRWVIEDLALIYVIECSA